MNKGGKIGLVVVLFVLLGVGGYYGYKMLYKPKEEEDDDEVIIIDPKKDGGGGGGSSYASGIYPIYSSAYNSQMDGFINITWTYTQIESAPPVPPSSFNIVQTYFLGMGGMLGEY